MEFFDMFVFNNVKSGLEIIVYQPNKVVFKVKMLSLRSLNHTGSPDRWAEVGKTYIMVKGVFVRFGFDAIRISQIQRQVKNKATKNAS